MKTTINVNGKDVEIELTKDQVAAIKKASIDPMDYKNYAAVCAAGNIDPIKSLPYPSPVSKKQVSANGLFKLETIHDAFAFREEFKCAAHQAWEPDYSNAGQRKYRPYHDWVSSLGRFVFKNTFFTYTFTTLGSRLCTDTEEKTVYIAKTFNAEWNEFLNPQI